MATTTKTGSVVAAGCEKHVDGTRSVIITISIPVAANPVEKAATAAPPDITNVPALPTLVGQAINVTIDTSTGVISAIAFGP